MANGNQNDGGKLPIQTAVQQQVDIASQDNEEQQQQRVAQPAVKDFSDASPAIQRAIQRQVEIAGRQQQDQPQGIVGSVQKFRDPEPSAIRQVVGDFARDVGQAVKGRTQEALEESRQEREQRTFGEQLARVPTAPFRAVKDVAEFGFGSAKGLVEGAGEVVNLGARLVELGLKTPGGLEGAAERHLEGEEQAERGAITRTTGALAEGTRVVGEGVESFADEVLRINTDSLGFDIGNYFGPGAVEVGAAAKAIRAARGARRAGDAAEGAAEQTGRAADDATDGAAPQAGRAADETAEGAAEAERPQPTQVDFSQKQDFEDIQESFAEPIRAGQQAEQVPRFEIPDVEMPSDIKPEAIKIRDFQVDSESDIGTALLGVAKKGKVKNEDRVLDFLKENLGTRSESAIRSTARALEKKTERKIAGDPDVKLTKADVAEVIDERLLRVDPSARPFRRVDEKPDADGIEETAPDTETFEPIDEGALSDEAFMVGKEAERKTVTRLKDSKEFGFLRDILERDARTRRLGFSMTKAGEKMKELTDAQLRQAEGIASPTVKQIARQERIRRSLASKKEKGTEKVVDEEAMDIAELGIKMSEDFSEAGRTLRSARGIETMPFRVLARTARNLQNAGRELGRAEADEIFSEAEKLKESVKSVESLKDEVFKDHVELAESYSKAKKKSFVKKMGELDEAERKRAQAETRLREKLTKINGVSIGEAFKMQIQGNLLTPMSTLINVTSMAAAMPLRTAAGFVLRSAVEPITRPIFQYGTASSGARLAQIRPSRYSAAFRGTKEGLIRGYDTFINGTRYDVGARFDDKFESNVINPFRAIVDGFTDVKGSGMSVGGVVKAGKGTMKTIGGLIGTPSTMMLRSMSFFDLIFRKSYFNTKQEEAFFANLQDIMEKKKELSGDELNNYLSSMRKQVDDEAEDFSGLMTYQNTNEVTDAINKALTPNRSTGNPGKDAAINTLKAAGRTNIPFVNSPVNLTFEIFRFKGGLWTSMYGITKMLNSKHMKSDRGMREAGRVIAEGIVGESVSVLGRLLAENGAVTGPAEMDSRERNLQYMRGRKPNSVNLSAAQRIFMKMIKGEPITDEDRTWQDGDSVKSHVAAGPIGLMWGIDAQFTKNNQVSAADFIGKQLLGEQGEAFGEDVTFESAMKGESLKGFFALRSLAELPMVQTIRDAAEVMTATDANTMADKGSRLISSMVDTLSATVYPNTASSYSRSTQENIPETRGSTLSDTIANQLNAKTSGFLYGPYEELPSKVDPFGRVLNRTPETADAFTYNVVDPFKSYDVKINETDKAINDMIDRFEFEESQIVPSEPRDSFSYEKQTLNLNPHLHQALKIAAGTVRRKALIDLSRRVQEMDEAGETVTSRKIKDELRSRYRDGLEQGKKMLFHYIGASSEDEGANMLMNMRAMNIANDFAAVDPEDPGKEETLELLKRNEPIVYGKYLQYSSSINNENLAFLSEVSEMMPTTQRKAQKINMKLSELKEEDGVGASRAMFEVMRRTGILDSTTMQQLKDIGDKEKQVEQAGAEE